MVLVFYCSTQSLLKQRQRAPFLKYKAIIMWSSFFFYSTEIGPISKFQLPVLVKQNEICCSLGKERERDRPDLNAQCHQNQKCVPIFFFLFYKKWLEAIYINIRWWSVGRCGHCLLSIQFVQPENFSPGGYNQCDKKKPEVKKKPFTLQWLLPHGCWACVVINILRRM